jgi:hypothetical protein
MTKAMNWLQENRRAACPLPMVKSVSKKRNIRGVEYVMPADIVKRINPADTTIHP